MSGSRLGRGRVGRLALLGCGTVSVLIIMFLYKSTSSEMARLRDLHVKCAQQQEALATQLQVIYDYKIQLEKTLSNEKSANAAVKEELQQKATRERSLRDKDSLEAMQRFNALQQNYKLLQTEHQDLKDDCKKKEDVALENAKRLEATLLELRQQQKKAAEEQERSTEHLKNKYLALQQEHQQLEEKYNSLKKLIAESDGNVDHLQKQVIQLQRELEEAKKTPHFSVGGLKTDNLLLQRPVNDNNNNNNNDENVENEKPAGVDNNSMQVIRPSSQQQVSSPSSDLQAGENPQPLQAPQNHQQLNNNDNNNNDADENNEDNIIDNDNNNKDGIANEERDDIRFENRNGNIVPAGPNDAKLPIPYDLQREEKSNVANEILEEDVESQKQVLRPPGDAREKIAKDSANVPSSKAPAVLPVLKPQLDEQAALLDDEPKPLGDPKDFE